MAETLVEKNLAKERLERYLATHKVKIAHTVEELYAHSIKDDNGEEVDEFLKMREQWRKEDNDSHREID
jgi:hypothetical protein